MSSDPQITPVTRIDQLSVEAFRADFQRPGKPVVITGSLGWRALRLWTHEWFRDQFGATEVELSVNPTHTAKTVKMRLGTYIQRILSDDRMRGGLYLDQFPLARLPELHRDFSIPAYCPSDRRILAHLWLGPATTVLGFHKDNHDPLTQVDNIFVQICGRKRILLASPENDAFMYPRPREQGAYWHSQVDPDASDFGRFPLFRNARLLEAIVEPGDIAYIPRNYWHYVRALQRSISMSFWWIPFRLMEIGSEYLRESRDPSSQQLAKQSRLAVHDIEAIGGITRLAEILAEFTDPGAVSRLRHGLMSVAEQDARPAIEMAFQKAGLG